MSGPAIEKMPGDPQAQNRRCSKWTDIVKCLDEFPAREATFDEFGEIASKEWVFRGLKSSTYQLEPTIEREAQAKSMDWSALETLVSSEFKARARSHLNAASIPNDELTWLAQMQHYAVPTRLLDFTYSPFVALYFAVRNVTVRNPRRRVRLWALDVAAINRRFWAVANGASRQDPSVDPRESRAFSLDPDFFETQRDSAITATQGWHTLIAETLSVTGRRRGAIERAGCVCVASPPALNPRLVGQQGVFLLNFAEDLCLRDSLTKMMKPRRDWCMTIDIPQRLISEIERRLFQMNIHEQALFPDMEGLSGLIRQKVRLHWK